MMDSEGNMPTIIAGIFAIVVIYTMIVTIPQETYQQMAETITTIVTDITEGIPSAVSKVTTNNKIVKKAETNVSTKNNTKTEKEKVLFPENPLDFKPKGLTLIEKEGTFNGKVKIWLDANKQEVFSWDEDLTYGQHYHIKGCEGIHFWPLMEVPEPYAAIYFR